MVSKGSLAYASPENLSVWGPGAAAMVLVRAEVRTAPLSAASVWTQPWRPPSASVTSSSAGRVHISGWRRDLTDRCVLLAKLASATKSSCSTARAALGSRPTENRPLLALKARGQSWRTEGDSRVWIWRRWPPDIFWSWGSFPVACLPQHRS